jgi:hypothetical protein
MVAAIALAASLAALFASRDPTAATLHHRKFGQWTLEIRSDPFIGATRCSLHAPRIDIRQAVAVFHFPRRTDTFDAMYKVDAGPAVSWRVNSMFIASHGARLETDDSSHPSGGEVAIPLPALDGATAVTIRPGPDERAHAFRLDGLSAALTGAGEAGCKADFRP